MVDNVENVHAQIVQMLEKLNALVKSASPEGAAYRDYLGSLKAVLLSKEFSQEEQDARIAEQQDNSVSSNIIESLSSSSPELLHELKKIANSTEISFAQQLG